MRVRTIAACMALASPFIATEVSANPYVQGYVRLAPYAVKGGRWLGGTMAPHTLHQRYQQFNSIRQWRPPPTQFQRIVPPQYRHHYAPSVRSYRVW
jgi:hypothetical protein